MFVVLAVVAIASSVYAQDVVKERPKVAKRGIYGGIGGYDGGLGGVGYAGAGYGGAGYGGAGYTGGYSGLNGGLNAGYSSGYYPGQYPKVDVSQVSYAVGHGGNRREVDRWDLHNPRTQNTG